MTLDNPQLTFNMFGIGQCQLKTCPILAQWVVADLRFVKCLIKSIFCLFFAVVIFYLNSVSVVWTTRLQVILTIAKCIGLSIIILTGLVLLCKGKLLIRFSLTLLYRTFQHSMYVHDHYCDYYYTRFNVLTKYN